MIIKLYEYMTDKGTIIIAKKVENNINFLLPNLSPKVPTITLPNNENKY